MKLKIRRRIRILLASMLFSLFYIAVLPVIIKGLFRILYEDGLQEVIHKIITMSNEKVNYS